MRTFVITVLGIGLLSACGGGGGGGGGGGVGGGGAVNPDLLAYVNEGQRLLGKLENSTETSPANLPTGQVTYRGVGVVNANPGNPQKLSPTAFGKARVDANFDTNTLEASVDDFVDVDTGENVNGRLLIRNGTLRDGAIAGNLSGRLDGGAISGVGEGGFAGDRGETVGIAMNGSISGGGFDGDFEGAIIGDR